MINPIISIFVFTLCVSMVHYIIDSDTSLSKRILIFISIFTILLVSGIIGNIIMTRISL